MIKIIFLDIDGVLNGYNWRNYLVYSIASKFNLLSFVKKHHDIFGIHEYRLRKLAKIIKATGAKVVISGTARLHWYHPYNMKTDRDKALENGLRRYNIEVIGVTGGTISGHRGDQINTWLQKYRENHPTEKIKFVVLDDDIGDLQEFIGTNLVRTKSPGTFDFIYGFPKKEDGLREIHVKEAIRILNEED